MSATTFHRNLRLGVSGFPPEDAGEIAAIVKSLWTANSPWVVSDETPVDALLLARGTRPRDPEHTAILRVNLGTSARARVAERRLEPLSLRKPIRAAALRVALDAAIARIKRFRK